MQQVFFYVHAACPSTCCMSMSILQGHGYAACPCPFCKYYQQDRALYNVYELILMVRLYNYMGLMFTFERLIQ
jgi:hypothetical protein